MNRLRFLTLLLVLAAIATRASAVTTERFAIETPADFASGELEGAAVSSSGFVVPGVDKQRIALPDATVAYAIARGSDGSLFVGTGNDGAIVKVRRSEVSRFASTGQLVVSALAFGDDGTLYAGTLPDGKIFAIARDGTSRELARPEGAEQVFALVFDARRKRLFAATGPNGKIFAIDREGRAEVFYDGEDAYVLSLALDTDGSLLAGTSDRALVLRLRAPGRAEVVADLPGNEVTALSVRDGEIAAVANEFTQAPAQPAPQGPRALPPQTRSRPRPGKGKLFRIGREGRIERVFADDDHHFTAVELARDGVIYVAGKDGRVTRVDSDRSTSTWIDVEERLVLALSLDSDSPVIATGDGAALYRILRAPASSPTFTSHVLDAQTRATFGRLVARSSGTITLATRTGNTERPDATWSEWSAWGSADHLVASPAARFLQVRVRFGSRDAMLRGLLAYYLPTNQRAVVTNVASTVDAAQATARRRGRQAATTTLKLTWRIDNPDNDEVRYRLRFRRENETTFRDLTRPDQVLTQTSYDWETTGVPDGYYVVEVAASDELGNPVARSLDSRAVSAPLLVDNHPPRFVGVAARGATITGTVVDDVGPISRLELALDGAPFRDVDSEDGLLDDAEERIAIRALPAGSHLVAIRATDAAGHTVVTELETRD